MCGIMAAYDMWRLGKAWRWEQLSREETCILRDVGATHLVIDLYWDILESSPGVYRWDFYDDYLEGARESGLRIVGRVPCYAPFSMARVLWASEPAAIRPFMPDPRSAANRTRLVSLMRAIHDRYVLDAYEVGGGQQGEAFLCVGPSLPDGQPLSESLRSNSRVLADLIHAFVEWIDLAVSTAGALTKEVWLSHVVADTVSPYHIATGAFAIPYLLIPYVRRWERQFRLLHDYHEYIEANADMVQFIRRMCQFDPAICGAQTALNAVEMSERAITSGYVGLICWAKYGIFGKTATPSGLRNFEIAANRIHEAVTNVYHRAIH